MTRLALLALACSAPDMHAPDVGGYLSGDYCGRVPVATYTATDGACIRLEDVEGALFKLTTADSCGGPPCILVQPGESAYVLENVKHKGAADWTVDTGPCEQMVQCCGYYPGDMWTCY